MQALILQAQLRALAKGRPAHERFAEPISSETCVQATICEQKPSDETCIPHDTLAHDGFTH